MDSYETARTFLVNLEHTDEAQLWSERCMFNFSGPTIV